MQDPIGRSSTFSNRESRGRIPPVATALTPLCVFCACKRRIALLRRVLLVALSVLLRDPALRAQLLIVACVLLLCLQVALRPFRAPASNLQETLCLAALCLIAALQNQDPTDRGLSLGASVAVCVIFAGAAAVVAGFWLDPRGRCGCCRRGEPAFKAAAAAGKDSEDEDGGVEDDARYLAMHAR